jgi:hypothetical protein
LTSVPLARPLRLPAPLLRALALTVAGALGIVLGGTLHARVLRMERVEPLPAAPTSSTAVAGDLAGAAVGPRLPAEAR